MRTTFPTGVTGVTTRDERQSGVSTRRHGLLYPDKEAERVQGGGGFLQGKLEDASRVIVW